MGENNLLGFAARVLDFWFISPCCCNSAYWNYSIIEISIFSACLVSDTATPTHLITLNHVIFSNYYWCRCVKVTSMFVLHSLWNQFNDTFAFSLCKFGII